MNNEQKILMCERYAQKAWSTSQQMVQEAANTGYFGKGYAVVAEETRRLADSLFQYADKARFEGYDGELEGIIEFAVLTGYLAVNASIEILNVEKTSGRIESMLVLSEDIRMIAMGLTCLTNIDVTSLSYVSPFVMPEIASPIKSSEKTDWFFRFSAGGVTFAENIANIGEICYLPKKDVSGDMFSLRGKTTPLIRCGQTVSNRSGEMRTVMIVVPEGNRFGRKDGRYAVPIDELDYNMIFTSHIGYNAPPKADHPFAEYARECWDVIGGDQLIFLDWRKLISR
jgi:chemotaxis signal transduction protein